MEKKQPALTIRPYFDQGLTTLQALLFTFVGFLLVTIICGTVVYILLSIVGLGRFIAASYIYGLFFVASIVILPPLFFELKKKAYARTVFRFYDDYLDFQYLHFYVGLRRGRIRYRDISDVRQQASALQEQRRLTNIYLFVPSMAFNPRAFAGLKIPDVPMRQDFMTLIMDLIERSEYPEAEDYAAPPPPGETVPPPSPPPPPPADA